MLLWFQVVIPSFPARTDDMRRRYSALSRTACYYAGSLNDSGITVKECARYSGLKSLSANNTGSMRFETAVHDHGRRLNQREFRPMAEVAFRPARQLSEYKGKGASASRELSHSLLAKHSIFILHFCRNGLSSKTPDGRLA